MKTKILSLALGAFFAIPCILHAEEVEISLMEVIQMVTLPENEPLDGPAQDPGNPTRPNDFRATIDGNSLSIIKQDSSIPSAQAIVVNTSTGSIVVNEQFTNSLQEQISTNGTYVLSIETTGGALTGQFIVQ